MKSGEEAYADRLFCRPGDKLVIEVLGRDGKPGGALVELRYTEDQNFRLYLHSEETCHGPEGCQPLIAFDLVRPDEKAKAEAIKDFKTQAGLDDLFDGLMAAGISAFLVDETGIHPVNLIDQPPRKKQN